MKSYPHPIIESEEIDAVNQVLKSGIFSGFRGTAQHRLGGEFVQAFEKEFKEYFGVKYAVSFNSATSALHAALIACKVFDEVITTPFTFSASASCIEMVKAIPIFADIQEDTFCINPEKVEKELHRDLATAIIPVHLMGHPVDMDAIMKLAKDWGLKVIEDAAQALGATYHGQKVGTIGDCGIFSFNQSKPVSTGEGGMLITNDEKIATIARAVMNHGEVSYPDLDILGYNYRMCEMEAALGLAQFKKLDKRNAHRIMLANHLTEALKKIDGLTPPVVVPDCTHVYYTYGIKYDESIIGMPKVEFQKRLMAKGVYFGMGGQKPLHLLPFYGGRVGDFPVAERMEKEMMFTDILRYPMTIEDVDEIISIIREVLNEQS